MLTYIRASSALNDVHDPATARMLTGEGLAIAREIDYLPGEMLFLALDGLALVAAGEVEEGMRHLDEATTAAMAGEVEDARLVELICCHLVDACQRVRDFERAREWCRRVEEIAARLDDAVIFTMCRTYYGELLVWRGAWAEAELALSPRVAISRTRGGMRPRASCGSRSCGAVRGDSTRQKRCWPKPGATRSPPWWLRASPSTEATLAGEPTRPSGTCAVSAWTIA